MKQWQVCGVVCVVDEPGSIAPGYPSPVLANFPNKVAALDDGRHPKWAFPMQAATEISFGSFRFDLTDECLWRGTQPISLRPKAFAVLKLLVEHPGRLVTKQQVLDAVWP